MMLMLMTKKRFSEKLQRTEKKSAWQNSKTLVSWMTKEPTMMAGRLMAQKNLEKNSR